MPLLGMIPHFQATNNNIGQETDDEKNRLIENQKNIDADRKEDKEMMKKSWSDKNKSNSFCRRNVISNSKKNKFLLVNQDKYFGIKAKTRMNVLFQNSLNDLYFYPNADDLPEEKKTPRSLYMREIAAHNLLPLPLLLRKNTTPFDVSLAHR
jgi:hypothetical protein